MLVSHIARKISTNNREVVKKVCNDYVEQGFAEMKDAKEVGFEKSVGMAYHITPNGLEKAEKIQKIMDEHTRHRGFF